MENVCFQDWDKLGHDPIPVDPIGKAYKVFIDGLRPGSTYKVKWAVCTRLGWSAWSTWIAFSTEVGKPDTPEPFLVSNV